ncbi:MAG: ABC transporter permease [Nitrososphaerales archaeon]|jgi:ABC-2 type transport system permease protein
MGAVARIGADLVVFARSYARSRVGLFFGFVFPVILILIFGAIFSGGGSAPTVYAQNLDGGPVGAQFLGALNSTGSVTVSLVPASQNLSAYLLSRSASDGLIVPQDFSADYRSGHPVNVTEYWNPSSSTSEEVYGVTNGVLQALNLQRANGTQVIGMQTLSIRPLTYVDFLIPGLIGFSILVNPMSELVEISSEYKRERIFKQLSLTPLTKADWLAAKVGFYIGTTCVSFLIMSVVGIYAFGAQVTLTPWVIPFLLVGPFLFVSLGMLVGTVSNTPEAAGVAGNLVIFPMMFLSGTFFPVSSMPGYLQAVAHVLPLYYVIAGLNNAMIYGNVGSALVDVAVLAFTSAVVFALAVRLFRWREP